MLFKAFYFIIFIVSGKDFLNHPLLKEGAVQRRDYQEVIAARALEKGNTLVVAPTALGKTIVAVLLSAEILSKSPESKVLVLAPTKPLAVQHKKSFSEKLSLGEEEIALLTGTIKPSERIELFEKARIIAATPQTIENDVIQGRLDLSDVGLIVFDEAHRAVKDYAYVFIAGRYMKQAKKPFVLALTASPGSSEEKISEVCANLFIGNVEVKSLQDSDVRPYVNEVSLEYLFVDLPKEFTAIKSALDGFIQEQLSFLKKIGYARSVQLNKYRKVDLLKMQSSVRQDMIKHGKERPYLFQAVSKIAALLKVSHATLLLETQGISALQEYFDKMREASSKAGSPKALKLLLEDPKIVRAMQLIRELKGKKVDHPKLEKLASVLEKQFKEKPDSRVIVFNHYRDSIKGLAKGLGNDLVRPVRFVGQATKGSDEGMSQKSQIDVLDRFRAGEYNALLASSVAEEGLDIPEVDLVVFFEPVPSEIRSIQRRGRTGRLSKGNVVVLIAKGTRDEAFFWSSKSKEKKMYSTLRSFSNSPGINAVEARAIEREKPLGDQTVLSSFSGEKAGEREVVVYADTREQASSVVKELSDKCRVIVKQLDVGDYILSEDVIVERKTVSDFLNSLIDGRLFAQVRNLSDSKSPLIILEGDPEELYSSRNIHENAIKGALTSIALRYRVPLLYSRDMRETAEYLHVIAKREQLGLEKDVRLRVGRKGLTLSESQQFIVESLPHVGSLMAKRLLNHFGSVKAVMNASKQELMKVEKLGSKKASAIRKVIDRKYKKEPK